MKINAAVLFCSFVLLALFVQAQVDVRNQVERIRKLPTDTAQVRQLREAGMNLLDKDSALSKKVFEEALQKSIALQDADAITNSYRMLGIWYATFNDRDKALDCYRASLQSAESNHHLYLMAGAGFNIGNVKFWKGEYDSCIHYYLQTAQWYDAPEIFADKTLTEKILDKKKSDLYSNMSSVFNTLKNLPKADEYIDKAIAVAKKYNSAAAADALAYYMQQKADNYSSNGDMKTALSIRLQYLPRLQSGTGGKSFLQGSYQSISGDYFDLEKIDTSKLFAEKSLSVATEIGIADGIANANLQLGKIALHEKDYALAETHLSKCSNYFLSAEDPVEQRTYFDLMRQLMFAEGRYKEAYGYFENYAALNDTVLNSERTKQFSEREAKYQSEKKDAQIKLQAASIQQKNTLNYVLAASAVIVLLLLILTYRNYKQRQRLQQQRIKELETEKQLAATEAVLKGEEGERTRLAKDLHDGLGGMLSGIKYSLNTMKGNLIMTAENAQAFERSIDMLDSSIQEMRRVAHNLMPEALVKFGLDAALRDFCNGIAQSGAITVNYQSIGLKEVLIEQTTSIAIYRIVQELVNNVLKHAAAKNLLVQVTKTDGHLSVTVEDDGNGFDTTVLKGSKGIGWSNVQNRLAFLGGKVDVDAAPGKGTSVFIEIPAQ